MVLPLIWVSFTIIIGFSNWNSFDFVCLSLIMLYLTYLYNAKIPTKLTLKQATSLSVIPNIFIWYILYKCNDFLIVYPYNQESFVIIFLLHSYAIVHILSER